jgi:hypothetical protein
MGSLNFILAFSFVFHVMVLAINFYCGRCFKKKLFCELLGFFVFKIFEGLQFSCHFEGPHFLFLV